MKNQLLTAAELVEIQRQAVNDTTRAIAAEGRFMHYEDVDRLDEPALAWLYTRLGLRIVAYSAHVELVPVRAQEMQP